MEGEMTKKEKLKKIDQLLEELEKEEETTNIPKFALVLDAADGEYRFMYESQYPDQIAPQVLACTNGARIPNAVWAAMDRDGIMQWYEDEPHCGIAGEWYSEKGPCHFEGKAYRVPCPMDDWKEVKWRIR
jgi:hypothetical protein